MKRSSLFVAMIGSTAAIALAVLVGPTGESANSDSRGSTGATVLDDLNPNGTSSYQSLPN